MNVIRPSLGRSAVFQNVIIKIRSSNIICTRHFSALGCQDVAKARYEQEVPTLQEERMSWK
jgi:hypothetical protein